MGINKDPQEPPSESQWGKVFVWAFPYLLPGEFKIYSALRTFADKKGICSPSTERIADRAQTTVGAVRNAIAVMRKYGLINTTVERWPNGSVKGLIYQMVSKDPETLHLVRADRKLDKEKKSIKKTKKTSTKSPPEKPLHHSGVTQLEPVDNSPLCHPGVQQLEQGKQDFPQVRTDTPRSDILCHSGVTHIRTDQSNRPSFKSEEKLSSPPVRNSLEGRDEKSGEGENFPEDFKNEKRSEEKKFNPIVDDLRSAAYRVSTSCTPEKFTLGPQGLEQLISAVHAVLILGWSEAALVPYMAIKAKEARSLVYLLNAFTAERLQGTPKNPIPTQGATQGSLGPCGECDAPKAGISEQWERRYRTVEAPDVYILCPACNPDSPDYGKGLRPPSNRLVGSSAETREKILASLKNKTHPPVKQKRNYVRSCPPALSPEEIEAAQAIKENQLAKLKALANGEIVLPEETTTQEIDKQQMVLAFARKMGIGKDPRRKQDLK